MSKTTATDNHVSCSQVRALDSGLENSQGKGRILRVKRGYNPNSSSLGSDIFAVFAIPGAFFAAVTGFGAVSGMILSAFLKNNDSPRRPFVSAETDERDTGPCSEKESNV